MMRLGVLAVFAGCTFAAHADTTRGGTRTSPDGTRTSPDGTSAEPEIGRTSPTARWDMLPPYPSQPADPWVAVTGDQPVRWSAEQADEWKVRGNEHKCTAAADHCLDPHTWFFEKNADRERGFSKIQVHPSVFGPDGPIVPTFGRGGFAAENGYTAYRTVPATKKTLAKGTLAVVLERPTAYPISGEDAVELTWYLGTVDEVDFDLGTVKIAGHKDSALLTSARVAVLKWEPGGKVEIVGGRKRNELAVKKQDVFLPQE